jgi:hypothetical protein
MAGRRDFRVLGARLGFESNSRGLLDLAEHAFGGLPPHRLRDTSPALRIRLLLRPREARRRLRVPPAPTMLSGFGLLAGAPNGAAFAVLTPGTRAALLALPDSMLRYPYETRYEYIEFAAFTLASRAQRLASLHAACVGRSGRAVLLMGASGAGKSTVTLLCLMAGFEMVAEDSVFVAPEKLLATGLANFLHVRRDSLRWIPNTEAAALIRASPVIRRRSGVEKLECDLRGGRFRLARKPPEIAAVVFLSERRSGKAARLAPLSSRAFLTRLRTEQAYAAGTPEWPAFVRGMLGVPAFELRRGAHPMESVESIDSLLMG